MGNEVYACGECEGKGKITMDRKFGDYTVPCEDLNCPRCGGTGELD